MYGKHFESMYTGSMFGKPFAVYAVWGYVISHMRQSRKDGKFYIELNPEFLAAMFASTVAEVIATIEVFCGPDLASRSKAEKGRKLIPEFEGELHNGPMEFWVVNGKKYKEIRDEEERRQYNRVAKRKQRERQSSDNVHHVNDIQSESAMSANTDPDPESDTKEEQTREGNGPEDQEPKPPLNHVERFERNLAAQGNPTALELFEAYKEAVGRPGAQYDWSRRELFEDLVHNGITAEIVRQVTLGAKLDEWAVKKARLSPNAILKTANDREKHLEAYRESQRAGSSSEAAKSEPVVKPGEIPCPPDEFFLEYPVVAAVCKRMNWNQAKVLGSFRKFYGDRTSKAGDWPGMLFSWLQQAELRVSTKGVTDVVKLAKDVAVGDVRGLLNGIGGDG